MHIDASSDTILRQAGATADVYLTKAVECIDDTFGKDYAKQHPELVAAFMNTAAQDYHSAVILQASQNIQTALSELAELRSE